MEKINKLKVVTTQGFSGELIRESQFVFNYRTAEPACEIALAMPLRSKSYTTNILPGVFRQNLPEGFLLDWIKERFAKVTKMDDMTLLAITGRDVIGRVRTLQETDDGSPKIPGEHLNSLLTWKGTEDLFSHLANQYAMASGISGVQPKVVVPLHIDTANDVIEKISMKDRSVIVKSSGDDYPNLAENEYFCMSIAKSAGLNVPKFWLSDDKKLFIVARFDLGEKGYLGFEDMTSLMDKQDKYAGSYELLAKAVGAYTNGELKTQSLEQLFSTVALSVLLRNGDAHLKNFGLLYTDPTTNDVRLSPIYDIVNTTVYIPNDPLALKLNGSKFWTATQDLIEFGKIHCYVDHPEQIIERIATAAMDYRPPEESQIWREMKPLIEKACFGLAANKTVSIGDLSANTDVGEKVVTAIG
ncbi:type II toxin-antitoxin system HipA family toxin [Propionivibrio sp.]|uniref:type II toxin-antitoxin system HipA family toxin n=1 Tax=Propionivibrio sp. TaxID=2212460 RepID=UPI003BF12190